MLFEKINILTEDGTMLRDQYVGTQGGTIAYIGERMPDTYYGTKYPGKNRLLMPGFYNTHSHIPMTLLRGYAENLPLQSWLNDKVFPFEDKLQAEDIRSGTMLGIAEMLACGTVSFTDMYYFCDTIADCVLETGIKCNISRGLTVFDDSAYETLPAYRDNLQLLQDYQGAGDGRLLVDLCIHGEYTSTPHVVRAVAAHAKDAGTRMHIHLSETKTEHEACKARHGMTPAAYMEACGVFDVPTTAAHCVWLEENDFDILKRHGVSVAMNPASNMKLASGYANVPAMLSNGLNITLGTDGAASNNSLNIWTDLYLLATIYKGYFGDATLLTPAQLLHIATRAGALSQGRTDAGVLAEGMRADLCVINMDTPQFTPCTDVACNLVYAAQGSDVLMTMVDGKVLYQDGEYKTLDVEKIKFQAARSTERIIASL